MTEPKKYTTNNLHSQRLEDVIDELTEENLTLKDEIKSLHKALQEIHRRTALLLHQNTGRWDNTLEHDRRTIGVLQVNQEIVLDALSPIPLRHPSDQEP